MSIPKFNIGSVTSTLSSKVSAATEAAKTKANDALTAAKTRVGTELGRATTGAPSIAQPQYKESDNNYSHEGRNIVTSGKKEEIGKINLNDNFLPNLLDNYDTVTYHWKLFLTTQEASSTGKVFNTDSQIIIAETGVSDLTIDNVIIESVTTPSVDSGTGTSTLVKFEIVEPAGAGLIDQIFYQSLALGIGNWNVMPFYLQLTFKSRNPKTAEADNGEAGTLSNLRWLWTLKLSDMKANVTTVGTKYEISAIVYNELAQSNAYFSVPHTIVLENIQKFDDAMGKLMKALNDDQFNRLIDTVSIPDVYKIVIDPKLAGYHITPSNHTTDSSRNDSTIILDGKNASFPPSTGVDKIIDTLLSHCKEVQELIKNSDTPGADGKPMNQEISQMKKFWRIITESRPIKFDPRQNNYAREFTIFVVQYDIGILDSNIFQDSAGAETLDAEKRRLETYIKKSILKKKYNYIFTGLNDQIYNFDIRINNAFASAQARMGGIYHNAAMADKGLVYQANSENQQQATQQLQKAISFLNSASKGELEADQGLTIAQTKNAIESSELPPSYKERYLKLLENAKPENRVAFLESVQTAGGIDQDAQLTSAKLRARKIATPIKDRTTDKNYQFVSDVNIFSDESRAAYIDYVKGIKGKLRPVARKDTMQERQVGASIESSSNPGIQKLSTIFSVAMHSTYDISFAKVRLEIKGDPFWLFPQPMTDNGNVFNSLKPQAEAIDWIKNAHFQVKDSVNINGTDNFIIIRFRTPRVFDINSQPQTDTNALTDVETLSGVFKVVRVHNKFQNGKFSQELECLMDYQINILNFMEEIESNAATPDKSTAPQDLLPKSELARENKTLNQRILGKVDVPGVQSALTEREKVITNSLNQIGPKLTSNIPVAIPNDLAGLKDKFFG